MRRGHGRGIHLCGCVLWVNHYDNAWDAKDYVNMRIDERFREEGIEIPFRQIDIRMRSGEVPRT